MELIGAFVDIILHLDRHLVELVQNYGVWIYAILFLIIFVETGVVVMPFMPGDSLLFVAGAVAAAGGMEVTWLAATIMVAALCGDNVNYGIGRLVGPRVFRYEGSRWLRRENLERTHRFMEKYGPKAIIIARFVPIVRTFVPFVCGIGRLTYFRFLAFSMAGALLWVGLLVPAGYFFGNLAVVKNNLTAVILGIIFVSILPGIIEYLRHRPSSVPTPGP